MSSDRIADATRGAICDIPGVAVGHWTDTAARTGCTVIIFPKGTIGSGEVRGGAPASRELALLESTCTVAEVDAVLLTGGSAFGLAAADGVMTFLESSGRGFETPAGRVPIVPALGLFDLAVGDGSVRPDAAAGHSAARRASSGDVALGAVGAGAGCTTGKWFGAEHIRAGGLVGASSVVGSAVVGVLIAVNAVGAVGARAALPQDPDVGPTFGSDLSNGAIGTNTTIGVIATSARLTKTECHLLAQSAHVGLARAVFPSHTRFDGDAFIACATRSDAETVESPGIDALRVATIALVESAICTLESMRVTSEPK